MEGADGGDCRVQVPPPPPHPPPTQTHTHIHTFTRKAGGTARIGAPRAPGGARSDGSGSPSCGRRTSLPRRALRGGRRVSPAGRGSGAPALPPSFSLPSPPGRAHFHFLRAAAEGAARGRAGEGAAGASAGSALFSAARPESAVRPAPPARAHLLDGRHRVPALGHPGGEVGGGG